MASLFVRFYAAVIGILFAALCVQTYIKSLRFEEDSAILYRAYAPMVLIVTEFMSRSPDPEAALEELRPAFNFPTEWIRPDEVSDEIIEKYNVDWPFTMYYENKVFTIVSKIRADNDGQQNVVAEKGYVRFGPLPVFADNNRTQVGIGVGVVLAIAGIAIAILLKMVYRPFGMVEAASKQITLGEYSTRIDEKNAGASHGVIKAFNKMATKIEQVLASQKLLIQSVSHELRTPLTRIRFATELMASSESEQDRRSHISDVEEATDELSSLILELLHLVRLENLQNEPIVIESCDVLKIVESQIARHCHLYPQIEYEVGSQLSTGKIVVNADARLLDRVLANLILNASKFCQKRVQIDGVEIGSQVQLVVQDDGPGIEEDEVNNVLMPFVQLNPAVSGSGLGLTIVHQIVKNHSGTIRILRGSLGGCRVETTWNRRDDSSE